MDARPYSIRELIACFLSRNIEDGLDMGAGAASPIPRAAVLLAHLLHGPNITVKMQWSRNNMLNINKLESYDLFTDYRQTRWAESLFRDDDQMLWCKRRLNDRFFIGPIQVDKYGNCNLIGIGKDFSRLKLRGPGAAGTVSIGNEVRGFDILPNRHDARTFVEKCDYISTVGFGDGSPDYRKKLGLRGGGPRFCVTPLCVLDFDEKTKRMRLKSVHPGVTVEEVVKNTGFEPIMPNNVPVTEAPTSAELELLRTRIDPTGTLKD